MKYFLVILISLASQYIIAQNLGSIPSSENSIILREDEEERQGFSISMNMGMYFGNKKSAVLYNGNCYIELEDPNFRCYTIEERIGKDLNVTPNSPYHQILQYFNNQGDQVSDFTIPDDSYPTKMRFTPAFMFGFNISYYLNNENAITFNINSVKLTAKDAFSVKFTGGEIQPNEPDDIRLFTIFGNETRLNLMLGLKKLWPMNESSSFYFEYGGTMLTVKMEDNKVNIGGRDYSLIFGGTNFSQNSLTFNPNTYTGFGFYVSPGMQFVFNEKMSLDVGVNLAREKVGILDHLAPEVVVKSNLWHSALYIRFGI